MSQRTRKWRKYPPEFRRAAVERMKACDNITELARELGIRRKWLYQWSQQERVGREGDGPQTGRAEEGVSPAAGLPPGAKLRKQIQELESLVARQNLEIDFFKGALQRIGQRRGKETTASASTNRSEA